MNSPEKLSAETCKSVAKSQCINPDSSAFRVFNGKGSNKNSYNKSNGPQNEFIFVPFSCSNLSNSRNYRNLISFETQNFTDCVAGKSAE